MLIKKVNAKLKKVALAASVTVLLSTPLPLPLSTLPVQASRNYQEQAVKPQASELLRFI